MNLFKHYFLKFKVTLFPIFLNLKLLFLKSKYHSKVFCIGYQKTGTTSVGKAINSMGLRHFSWYKPIYIEYKKGNIEKVLNFTAKFDSFDDLPWFDREFIPILYDKFPHSKFINLTREELEWKNSYKRYFNKTREEVEIAFKDFQAHQAFVEEFFKDKRDRLLTVGVGDNDTYKKIAKFLDKPLKGKDRLPHLNKS